MDRLLKYGLMFYLVFFSTCVQAQFENIRIQLHEPTVTQEEAELLKQIVDLSGEDPEKAIELLTAAITPETSPALDFALGNFYFQKGELNLAEDSYRRSVEKMPLFNRARANLGRTLIMQNKI
ncbi:MAG: hypothetical protein KAV18_06110, partial [Candidatus Omnitrophica bacterium]|nr:hypothetical protein [Candidatus Omnitrophota bacterium]